MSLDIGDLVVVACTGHYADKQLGIIITDEPEYDAVDYCRVAFVGKSLPYEFSFPTWFHVSMLRPASVLDRIARALNVDDVEKAAAQ